MKPEIQGSYLSPDRRNGSCAKCNGPSQNSLKVCQWLGPGIRKRGSKGDCFVPEQYSDVSYSK